MESSKLSSFVASMVLHDLASPVQGLMSGAEMAFDDAMGGGMRAEGEKLLQDQIRTIAAKIAFMRMSLGSQAINDDQANLLEARRMTEAVFTSIRKPLPEWKLETQRITNRQLRVLLNMIYLAKEPVAKKGLLTVSSREEGGQLILEAAAVGEPGSLRPDVLAGLDGREPSRGWGGGAIHPLFTRLLGEEAGMTISAAQIPGGTSLSARGPIVVP
jgi:hypothetical protein